MNPSTLSDAEVPPLLKVQNLQKDYGGIHALRGLTLAISKGEIHCLIGPNGAGKSTLFKLVMGLERPTSGNVLFKGQDVTRQPPFRRARMGLTVKFQNIRVYQDLTVYQNMFIPLRRHHAMKDIPASADKLLTRLNLAGLQETMVENLSHGQQQWLSIGMSIAADPELLLLDEPAAGMSAEETEITAEILRELNAQGITIVVIEHDMGFIRSLDTQTSVLHLGRLFAQGSFGEIEANDEVRHIYLGSSAAG